MPSASAFQLCIRFTSLFLFLCVALILHFVVLVRNQQLKFGQAWPATSIGDGHHRSNGHWQNWNIQPYCRGHYEKKTKTCQQQSFGSQRLTHLQVRVFCCSSFFFTRVCAEVCHGRLGFAAWPSKILNGSANNGWYVVLGRRKKFSSLWPISLFLRFED